MIKQESPESRNVYFSLERDPFGKTWKRSAIDKKYKLNFAKKMYRLEQQIKTAKDPNDKAEYMLIYARGMKNSVMQCWTLTSYYSYYNWCNVAPYVKLQQKRLLEKSNVIKDEAFQIFTDKKRAAQAYYDWGMFKTAATKYPDTEIAEYIRGNCDTLIDYI